MKKKNIYLAKIERDCLRIYINNVIHFTAKQNQLLGFQGYIDGYGGNYVIEFYTKDNTDIKTEYDSFEKWSSILNQLDKLNIF